MTGELKVTPLGWQGAAQHSYTTACDGIHAPGPCPDTGSGSPYQMEIVQDEPARCWSV